MLFSEAKYINLKNKKPLNNEDYIRVFHGFYSEDDVIKILSVGLSGRERARRIYSYESGNNPYGLFVSIDINVAEKFASSGIIIEFSAKYKDLESPVWVDGRGFFVQGEYTKNFKYLDEREKQKLLNRKKAKERPEDYINKSDKPELAEMLYDNSEHQALFLGDLNPNMIKNVWYNKKRNKERLLGGKWEKYTVKQFLNIFEYSKKDVGKKEKSKKEIIDFFKDTHLFKANDDFSFEEIIKTMKNRYHKINFDKEYYKKIIKKIMIADEHELRDMYDFFPKQIEQINNIRNNNNWEKDLDNALNNTLNESKNKKNIYLLDSGIVRGSGANVEDENKIKKYTDIMKKQHGWGNFPPIKGELNIIDQFDIDEYKEAEEDGYEHELAWNRPIDQDDIGKEYLNIYDGHHRAYAALNNNFDIEFIKENKILTFKEYLLEYTTNDIIYLKKYLNMSEEDRKKELTYTFVYLLNDFLNEYDKSYDKKIDELLEKYGSLDVYEEIYNEYPKIQEDFGDWLYNKLRGFGSGLTRYGISETELPSWVYFWGNAKILKNQWLIHFTNDAYSIFQNGFTYGVDDMSKLGLTTYLSDFDKKYGGYNFAYDINDFDRYYKNRHGNKYGKEAVLFTSSGVKDDHIGDQEPQVIFWGKNAKNIIPITQKYGDWSVQNMKSGEILYEDEDISKVVDWVIDNFNQYRKVLVGKI